MFQVLELQKLKIKTQKTKHNSDPKTLLKSLIDSVKQNFKTACNQTEAYSIWNLGKTPNTDTFHAVFCFTYTTK